jgi:hypothetical protein
VPAVSRDFTAVFLQVRFPNTTAGWRSPLLITTIVAHDKTVFHCECDIHTHGGLTPAALVNVRLCIGKNRFFAD